jgi:pimeloyl-ACP methyl ester carboxylesterase
MKLPPPVIFVPGITASYLTDDYQLPSEVVWSVMTKNFDRFKLHPDNPRYEANQPAVIRPGQLFEVAYRELISEVRHSLSVRDDQPVPVYPFGYDWRQPLEVVERQFADFVTEVVERTKLTRHYAEDGYDDDPRVNLVGHSMGGLVIAGYLADAGKSAPVRKVATLATPFRGSFEAVVKMLTGTADLGTTAPSSREREAARVLPGLYHLMPTVKRGIEVDAGLSDSVYDPDFWQPSILQTIVEYVRLYAVDPGKKSQRVEQANALFKTLLDTAKRHRAKVEALKLADVGLKPDDWLAVVGVGSETRVRLKVKKAAGGVPQFDISSSDRADNFGKAFTPPAPDLSYQTGDGTVPFEGAQPGFLRPENLICVTPDDFGYWEVGDRLLTRVGGFHGILPNMDMVHRLIVRHFMDADDPHGNTWGRPAPGVAPEDWAPAIDGLKRV